MSVRAGIVLFPGSNCEQDCARALGSLGAETRIVWHQEKELSDVDIVVLPGGFAHGDYLRTGALARFSPIMEAVCAHARSGGLVIGICNGFQILCEAGLLPGALRRNVNLKFLCKWTSAYVDNSTTPFTSRAGAGRSLRLPINHFEGNWYCEAAELEDLRASGRLVLRYAENPNGSLGDVAGVCNEDFNVLGLMPHPERACEALLGSEDGAVLLGSMLDHVGAGIRSVPV
ncbi:MAG: phosphoribosylformylglycinamidine synthase subunit PurQ [Actinobacteria bacterium]|nr:phosphoribosylformylglycinamidine synthase subunit PurQ [Actinomycetota bacterium]